MDQKVILIYTVIRRTWLLSTVIISTCLSASLGNARKIWSESTTFLWFCSSVSLDYNFFLEDLKYSSNFMFTKSLTLLSVTKSFLYSHQALEYTTLCL